MPLLITCPNHVNRTSRILYSTGVTPTFSLILSFQTLSPLTPASRLLAKNEPFNVRSLLLLNHGPVFSKAWPELSVWFQNDSPTPFHAAHEKSLWNYIEEEEPRVLGDIFNDAMASDSRLNTNVLITECKHVFEGLTSLVDVGGGTGDLKGGGNLEFVGGDMFDQIPHANAILLKVRTIS
ncbi:hypothetical protein CQW23_02622 [Capsicum baccatum]|uniref:O-methyltransferase C-terminal domain-containing protein n=1 Tax=Capsicum baccatum TaxID=33114 RepID=A0A2G2XS25_CAPBA|nr:hypothetical protein CQW23_02622 [Capsicum baccatum]